MSDTQRSPRLPVAEEPLLQEEEDRPTILPLRYPDIWMWYKQQEGLFWPVSDADLTMDPIHWRNNMTPGMRAYYKYILAMFGPADEMITRNLEERFIREFEAKEVCYVYTAQKMNEQVHSEGYSRLIEAIFSDEERDEMFNAVKTMPVVGKMMKWVDDWICSDAPIGERVAAFALFEGGLFQGQFLSIQLLKEQNIMPGMTTLNELISRDEDFHSQFACFLLNNHIANRPSEETVHRIAKEASNLFDEFVQAACDAAREAEGLPATAQCPVPSVTEEMMSTYVRMVIDTVCEDMGYARLFKAKNPYPEAVKLSLNSVLKTNFFESLVTQYNIMVDYDFVASIKAVETRSFTKPEAPTPLSSMMDKIRMPLVRARG